MFDDSSEINVLNTGAYDDYHPYGKLIVTLYGDAKFAQSNFEGHYTLASTAVNGKHTWIHEQHSNVIWYEKENECWMIGYEEDLGTSKCGLHSTNDTRGHSTTTWTELCHFLTPPPLACPRSY